MNEANFIEDTAKILTKNIRKQLKIFYIMS